MASTDPYGIPGVRPGGAPGVRHDVRTGEGTAGPLPGVQPGGLPPEETPPGESSATTDLAACAPEEKLRGWGATPTVLILLSAFVVALGLVAMAVVLITD